MMWSCHREIDRRFAKVEMQSRDMAHHTHGNTVVCTLYTRPRHIGTATAAGAGTGHRRRMPWINLQVGRECDARREASAAAERGERQGGGAAAWRRWRRRTTAARRRPLPSERRAARRRLRAPARAHSAVSACACVMSGGLEPPRAPARGGAARAVRRRRARLPSGRCRAQRAMQRQRVRAAAEPPPLPSAASGAASAGAAAEPPLSS